MEAYFAGGCFWCMEKPYHTVDGVKSVRSGYCGGNEDNPVYADVKAQKTGHRETVKIVFDGNTVPFSFLLSLYLDSIDPFDSEGQFIDRGHSYTCAVYYTDENQRTEAENAIKALEEKNGKKVGVSVEKFKRFWDAEEYHQDFAHKNPKEYAAEYEVSGRRAFFESKHDG